MIKLDFNEDFIETCEDLIQDVLLLDALFLYKEQNKHALLRYSKEDLDLIERRLLDYLTQHAHELHRICKHYNHSHASLGFSYPST